MATPAPDSDNESPRVDIGGCLSMLFNGSLLNSVMKLSGPKHVSGFVVLVLYRVVVCFIKHKG